MEQTSNNRLTNAQIGEKLRPMTGWSYDKEHDQIERSFVRKNFLDAADFIQQIANVAEAHDHHPDILLSGYKNVKVMFSTHSVNGVTAKDFEMASAVDRLIA